jgi:hypothetical protein
MRGIYVRLEEGAAEDHQLRMKVVKPRLEDGRQAGAD